MPLEGLQVGRYRLLRLLGSGGMGEVYLAEDTRINRQVAIKIIRAETSAPPDADAIRLFEREVKAISALDHPHILALFDYGEEEAAETSIIYMVMPYRQENSLATWLKHQGNAAVISPQDVAYLVHQAASALQYAHDHQIIHQDVKPSNFLIRNNPENPNRPDLLLADFGVAKFSTATSSMSRSVRGTPTYMAPEQWDGEPVPATDQYALAVMTYELLTGRPPFQGSPMRMMFQHTNARPEPPSIHNPRIPKVLDEVILHALAKKPEERFASISAFSNAFQQATQGDDAPTFVKHLQSGELAPTISSTSPSSEHIDKTTPVLNQKTLVNTALVPNNVGTPTQIKRHNTLNGKALLLAGLATLIILASVSFFYFAGRNQPTANGGNITVTSQNNNGITMQAQYATDSAGTATAQAVNANATSTSQTRATATANANATATAIADANATATAIAANANPYPPYTGTLTLNDPLSSNDVNNWDVGPYCFFTGGTYHVQPPAGYNVNCFAHNTQFGNFAYQVQMTILRGDCGTLLFRINGGSLYHIYVCQSGDFGLLLYVNNNFNKGLISENSPIVKGLNQPNLIAVVANGSSIAIYVNQQRLAILTDNTLSQGEIGFGGVGGHPTEVVFSNAKIWTF